jgi:hypothetical protein
MRRVGVYLHLNVLPGEFGSHKLFCEINIAVALIFGPKVRIPFVKPGITCTKHSGSLTVAAWILSTQILANIG